METHRLMETHRELTGFEQRACLSYWYPKTQMLPSPTTNVQELELTPTMLSEQGAEYKDLVHQIEARAERMAEFYGLPLFFRTGQTSGKHSWSRTCQLESTEDIELHVRALAEYGHMVDMRGLPMNVWCLREWLDIEHEFTAFDGMPIGKEYRFFVQEEEVVHAQPYWPPMALERHVAGADWKKKLAGLNEMPPPQAAIDLANLVGEAVADRFEHPDSCWSVDVCKTEDRGWMLTDMSPAERSYFWDPTDGYESLEDKVGADTLNLPNQ